MTESERIDTVVSVLHEWYLAHRRDLPWRDLWDLSCDERAYRVWISEVMLQQTQVSRVIGSYKKFIQEFKTVGELAKATNGQVLMVWRGMGYNSRALRLRDGAKEIEVEHAGHFPDSFEGLVAINGIGPYTAGAIRTFAFDLPTPVIDTNIRRILHRTFIGPEGIDGAWTVNDTKLLVLMEKLMAAWVSAGYRGSDLLSAMMDYGSLVQTKMSPKWDICALSAAGLMKATQKNWKPPLRGVVKEKMKQEPGRMVGATYIPNRIFRGRIVEALRDHPKGLQFDDIGKWISPDHSQEQKEWLQKLITKLVQEKMLEKRGVLYKLSA